MPERTDQLIKSVRQMCEARGTRNVDLARGLGISAQGVWNILNGVAQPTGEQALALEELLLKNHMSTHRVFELPTTPRAAGDPGRPKTLASAIEMLGDARQEIAALKAAAVAAPKVIVPPAPPLPAKSAMAAPKVPATATPMSAWEKELERAAKERSAGLSSLPFEQQTIDELRIALNNERDGDKRTQIFKLIQLRKEENSLSNPRVRLRGL